MMRRFMVALIGISLLAAPATALAGGYGGHGHKGHGYRSHGHGGYSYRNYGRGNHGHRKHDNDAYYVGAGLLAGAVVLGALLSRPAYQAPPRMVYVRPVPRSTCVQDQVARSLPDGRIQTGTRTRCY